MSLKQSDRPGIVPLTPTQPIGKQQKFELKTTLIHNYGQQNFKYIFLT